MSESLVYIPDESSVTDSGRVKSFTNVLYRIAELEGEQINTPNKSVEVLETLLAKNRLFFDVTSSSIEVWYVPSRESIINLSEQASISENWPSDIHRKQIKTFRYTQGALFYFKDEFSDNQLEIFITDWSPSPAAGAIAIYKDHPYATGIDKKEGDFFTGKFVRHPLTGDLLPVWIAEWVKPEFGTGAVLVNPAHDRTDLEFGRAVGLPIRFGLVPTDFDGKPEHWVKPPIIKAGRTIKTGFYDGISVGEAMDKYFAVLSENQLAIKYNDAQVGKFKLADLIPNPTSQTVFSRKHMLISNNPPKHILDDPDYVSVEIDASALLDAISSIKPEVSPILIASSSTQDSTLLFLRLMFFDVYQHDMSPKEICLIQKVQETSDSLAAEASVKDMASLIRAPLGQISILKKQVFEQLDRFLRIHNELLQSTISIEFVDNISGPLWNWIIKTKDFINHRDPSQAFSALYSSQKQLQGIALEQRVNENALAGYFTMAYILFGLETPDSLNSKAVWKALNQKNN